MECYDVLAHKLLRGTSECLYSICWQIVVVRVSNIREICSNKIRQASHICIIILFTTC